MKLICELINGEFLTKKLDVDCWIIGIKGISYNMCNEFSLEEAITILNENYRFGINLERIFHEDDLPYLIEILKKLPLQKITYFFYSDLGVYQILKELNLVDKAVYHASTMLTNYDDLEYALAENTNVVLGKELTSEEIKKIDERLTKNIMIDTFGKFPIFYSRRKLISTYFAYRNLDEDSNKRNYSLIEEFRTAEEYPIIENNGTTVYEPFFYAIGKELSDLKHISYLLLYGSFLETDKFIKIIEIYHQFIKDNQVDIEEELSKIVPIYKGKLLEKTVLRKGEVNHE